MYAKPGNAWPFRAPGPSHRLLSYALLLISINVCAEAACTWTDRADTVGLQAAATQVNGVFSLDDCKAKCEENANCVAVEWQSPFLCYTYTTLTATATLTGRTYSTKTCTAADTTTTTTAKSATATTTTAKSEISTTTSKQGNESPGNPATAKNLKSLSYRSSDIGQLMVMWESGERTGPTNYSVTWEEQNGLESSDFTFKDSVVVTGYTTTTHTITNLLSYWRYRVTVHPYTERGASPSNTSQTMRTKESQPGAVRNFIISQPPDTAQRLDLIVICPEERERNGPITKFTYNSFVDGDIQVSGPSGEIQAGNVCAGDGSVEVTAEKTYTFTLRAVTSTGIEGNTTTRTKRVDPRPPKLQQSATGPKLLVPGQTTETSVTIDFSSRLIDPGQGQIVMAGFTVCVKSADEPCERASSSTQKSTYNTLKTWKLFKKNGYKGRYRPTPDNWHETIAAELRAARSRRSVSRRVARAVEDNVQYTIGENSACDQYNDTVYCNGQLPESTSFIIIIWACTNGGCSESPDVIEVKTKTPEEGIATGAIVGGIVAVIVVLVVVIVVVIFRRRFGRASANGDSGQRAVRLEDSLHDRKSMSMSLYPARVEVPHRNTNFHFMQESQVMSASATTRLNSTTGGH